MIAECHDDNYEELMTVVVPHKGGECNEVVVLVDVVHDL